jgi:hypothetical protein
LVIAKTVLLELLIKQLNPTDLETSGVGERGAALFAYVGPCGNLTRLRITGEAQAISPLVPVLRVFTSQNRQITTTHSNNINNINCINNTNKHQHNNINITTSTITTSTTSTLVRIWMIPLMWSGCLWDIKISFIFFNTSIACLENCVNITVVVVVVVVVGMILSENYFRLVVELPYDISVSAIVIAVVIVYVNRKQKVTTTTTTITTTLPLSVIVAHL